ncbi:MAG: S-layer homology domain-containing protein [Cyanobacteria bacterium P01_F01_bin.53]
MTQSPIEPPNSQRRTSRDAATGPSRPLTFDEMVAIFVAFLSLGSVLFWGLSRGGISLFADTENGSEQSRTTVENAQQPFNFGGLTDGNEEGTGIIADGSQTVLEPAQPNAALQELDRRAASKKTTPRERRGMWDNVKAGVASATAGLAGVTATADSATATPETTTPETAISETPGNTAAVAPPATTTPTEAPETPPPAPADLSEAAQAPPKEALTFNDVPDNYWAKPYIDALSSRGLISGFEEGDFRPDQPVTRGQIANIVSRTFELTADKDNLDFGDVTGDYWARESIGEVVQGGFMTGFPNDTFEPNSPVTRTQAFTTLVTGLGVDTPTNVQTALSRYTDANAIPKWANEKIAAATVGGLVVNYPSVDKLNPEAPTTRAELSAMIYQALVTEGIVEPVDSEYIVKP